MLTRLTGQNIHKKANYRAHTTGVDVEEREKNNHVRRRGEKKTELQLKCCSDFAMNSNGVMKHT